MTRGRAATAACLIMLVALNAWILARLFKTEYTPWMGSIEGSYIGLSRWIQGHWTELQWFPLWYGGIPFENAYPPLLHAVVAAVSQATGLTVARAYHVVSAAMYCLGPVALFWLVWRLSGSRWKAFVAGWVFSLLSPSAFLMPSVAADIGGVWAARRMQAMVGYGEGPHITSLTLIPVALAMLHAALRKPVGWRTAAAAVAVAAVPLTNWLGAFALASGVLALALARREPRLGRIVLIGLLAYALAAPWIRPSTVAAVHRNAQEVGRYAMGRPQYLYLAAWLAAAVLLGCLLRKSRVSEAWRFTIVFLLLMAVPPLGFEWLKIYPVPQPDRYHLEMEMALAMAAGLLLGQKRGWLAAPVTAGMLYLAWVQAPHWRRLTRAHLEPFDVTSTVEWETARWLQEHLPGQRVFAAGSTQFWLNAFSDNPQLGGGFDQGRSNPIVATVTFAVPYTEGDGADTAAVLRAFGVRAVVVGGERTRDAYRNFQDPGKFAGVLPERWRKGDDAVYEVPARSDSLAHVLAPEDLMSGPDIDSPALKRFAAALDSEEYPEASFRWRGSGRARIETQARPGQVVSVQVSWDPGWRAEANGAPTAVRRDGLGLIVVEPGCEGMCTIDLVYDGGVEAKVARVLCVVGIAVCVLCAWRGAARRRGLEA